ncbi:MAG: ABC transporter permease subunit, partial [Halobacteriales archaeon]|nr:ABC transporter permease subunit [Halobacteriales archaeon]
QPPYLFPQLSVIFDAFVEQVNEWDLVGAFVSSMTAMFLGYFVAAGVGIAVGLAMGLDERIDVMLNPYINAFYVAPVSAMVPLLILIGGPTFEVRAFVVFLFCVFEITVDTYEGVKTTPRELLEVTESFGADRWFQIRHVVIPHDIPYITAGLRLGIGRAVSGMILAEVLVDFVNLGRIIREFSDLFRIAGVLSIVLLLMVLSIVLTRVIQLLDDWLIPWDTEAEL